MIAIWPRLPPPVRTALLTMAEAAAAESVNSLPAAADRRRTGGSEPSRSGRFAGLSSRTAPSPTPGSATDSRRFSIARAFNRNCETRAAVTPSSAASVAPPTASAPPGPNSPVTTKRSRSGRAARAAVSSSASAASSTDTSDDRSNHDPLDTCGGS